MKTFLSDSAIWNIVSPAAVNSGAPISVGVVVLVAAEDVASGAVGNFYRHGQFRLPKASGVSFTVGAAAYLVNSTGLISTTGDTFAGVATLAASNDDGFVEIDLSVTATGSGAADLAGAGDESLQAGTGADANTFETIAFGAGAVASNSSNIALGAGATAAGGSNAMALGHDATAAGGYAIAIGAYSSAAEINGLAIGAYASATGASAFAIGAYASATAVDAIAIGAHSDATALGAVALGEGSTASGVGSVALGNGVGNTIDGTLAIPSQGLVVTDFRKMFGAGAPVDYTDGDPAATGEGTAGGGSEYTDITNANLYINAGTKAEPIWKLVTRAA